MSDASGLRPRTRPRPLESLLQATLGLDFAGGTELDARVDGITLDSRQVRPGDLYVALPGAQTHGARFVPQAVERGASAVLTDVAGAELAGAQSIPVVATDDPRHQMAIVAAELYGHPAQRLRMLAVTGTNGKTTTAHLLRAGLAAVGETVGLIGTIGYELDGEPLVGERTTVTTPESVDLQALLALMLDRGATAVAMEVSSHALALGRSEPVVFDVAGFTNLGRDHLDFHADQEDYFEAKATLFTPGHARQGVVSVGDDWGRRLLARCHRTGWPAVGFGTDDPTAADADYRAEQVRLGPGGTDFVLRTPTAAVPVRLQLPGDFNVANAVLALAMLDRLGIDPAAAAGGLASAGVPGRMQQVPLPPGLPGVVVDFAHTPQAVAATLAALRPGLPAGGRLIAVLGAGGDRDRAKRAPMGAAAAAAADLLVVTDDNPRTEDPAAIRAAVLAGAREVAGAAVVDGGDRASAIAHALAGAGPDDVVAILGKGHETGQQIGDQVLPFDDIAITREILTGGGR